LNVEITEPDVGPLQIQGPKSKEVMTDLFGADILDIPYYFMQDREVGGMRIVVSRTGYSGELGYELYLRDASRDGMKLWDAVIEAGEPHGLAPIGPCHIRRIEGGILAYGCDMTLDENPYEVGYGYKWMVELEQEQDFIGRDELRKIAERGVSRKLVGVEISGTSLGSYSDGSFPDFLVVAKHGQAIGRLTSACWSPRLKKNIGYAMVPAAHAEHGTELEIQRHDGVREAVVADRVFFRPEHAEQKLAGPSTQTTS
jgi:glycine cleavage system aminomethyltransferase T